MPASQVSDPVADHTIVVPEAAPPESAPEAVLVDAVSDHPPLEPVAQDWVDDGGWQHSHDLQVPDHHPVDHPGFDLF